MAAARGFTLIELLVVLAILALVTALALPRLSRSPDGALLVMAARDLAGGLQEARGRAVSTNRDQLFVVDLERAGYGLDQPERRFPDGVAVSVEAARQELQSPGRVAIRFHPDGSSTGGQVTLGQGGRQLRVVVDWLTGMVRVEE